MNRAAITLFCAWHMAAVLLFSLPREAVDPLTHWTRRNLVPLTYPYIYLTSQWQQWNFFSPDPLTLATTYVIQRQEGEDWKDVLTIPSADLPWWRRADELKLLRAIETPERDWQPLRERYMQLLCTREALPVDTPIRLQYRSFALPLPRLPLKASWWRMWSPRVSSSTAAQIRCPAAASASLP